MEEAVRHLDFFHAGVPLRSVRGSPLGATTVLVTPVGIR
jgi:hypothetical protein